MLELEKATDDDASSSTMYEDLKFIERVIEVTRCRDRQLVSEICADAGYFDLDLVCSHVLAFMDGVRSSGSSTTSDGELCSSTTSASSSMTSSTGAAGAKPKSRTTRRQRKQEKKCRAAQRHRSAVANVVPVNDAGRGVATDAAGCHGRLASSDEDDSAPFVISQQLKVLQI